MSDVESVYHVFFFFFQAEDGIRDVAVTGVQTCALPISLDRAAQLARLGLLERRLAAVAQLQGRGAHLVGRPGVGGAVERQRSEERRVGKECRSRWSPYH